MIGVDDIAAFTQHVLENTGDFTNQHVDIAADELDSRQMAAVFSKATGVAVAHSEQPIDEVRQYMGDDMALMFQWFDSTGYSVRIDELKAKYPQVKWTSFSDWTAAQNWTA